jgi:hypothetical protein
MSEWGGKSKNLIVLSFEAASSDPRRVAGSQGIGKEHAKSFVSAPPLSQVDVLPFPKHVRGPLGNYCNGIHYRVFIEVTAELRNCPFLARCRLTLRRNDH